MLVQRGHTVLVEQGAGGGSAIPDEAYLKAGAELSTLAVSLHEPLPIVATQGRGPIAEAFRAAWRNFVVVLSTAIASLGYLVPVLALGWTAVVLARRWRRTAAAV